MSGGYFTHQQWHIKDIADELDIVIQRQGKQKPKDKLYGDLDYYKKYPEEKIYHTYSKEVQDKMREALIHLRTSYIYVQAIDYLLAGDTGELCFLESLNQELNKSNLCTKK
jgi:hypothetical protein